jgi:tRNA pseudouridine38-40 synthase
VLVEVGRGQLAPGDVTRLLSQRSDLSARLTAPASGLFLEKVMYVEGEALPPIQPAVVIAH